jgi:hypothetical protein
MLEIGATEERLQSNEDVHFQSITAKSNDWKNLAVTLLE